MSVWTIVKGSILGRHFHVSIRKLVDELFDECSSVDFKQNENSSTFEFCFCDDGVSAAKNVEKFVNRLKENGIKVDVVAEIRFLT